MASPQTLTLSEAGYVLDRSTTTLNKAVDTDVIRAKQRRVGKAVQRLVGPAELRFLRLADELEKDLTPSGRRRLYGRCGSYLPAPIWCDGASSTSTSRGSTAIWKSASLGSSTFETGWIAVRTSPRL
ncbi:hypothetical protein [Mesorhizobium sp. M0910]|uniref:hypothetical protein n=1 Tax=Mesorhizobium sp. M0910 TaxID=2957025 RepID=UPI00333787E7